MTTNVRQFHVADDPEAGSALALLLAAAGYEVETDFHEGSVFISAEAVEPNVEVLVRPAQANELIRQMRQRMDDLTEEVEWAELSSEVHNVA